MTAIVRAWDERYERRPSANWKGTLLVLPPATGKTLCALAAACRILQRDEGDDPAVWLSDRPLLAAQAFDEFQRTAFLHRRAIGVLAQGGRIRRSTASDDLGLDADSSLEAWLARPLQAGRTLVFTTKGDSKSLRALDATPPGLTIVDEAHHATAHGWNEALIGLRSYLVVGLTGTPYRKAPESAETSRLLRRFCVGPEPWLSCFMPRRQARVRAAAEEASARNIAYGRPVESFYKRDFTGTEKAVLSAPTFEAVSLVDADGARIAVLPRGNQSQRIRFFENPFSDERDLGDLVHEAEIVEAALDVIDHDACERARRASVSERTTLVFARNIAHANRLQRLLATLDVQAMALHSQDNQTLEERHRALKQVREEAGSVLVCVDMLAEGVDLPTADLLVMARWTSSERLFWQLIGRGLRGPDIGGTERVDIVTYEMDFGSVSEDEDGASVQTVDELLLEAFGEHARHRTTRLKVEPSRRGRNRATDDGEASGQRRQGYMRVGDILQRKAVGLDGSLFDVVVTQTDSGAIVNQRNGVRHPWAVLLNLYDNGRRGKKYRFVVTAQR